MLEWMEGDRGKQKNTSLHVKRLKLILRWLFRSIIVGTHRISITWFPMMKAYGPHFSFIWYKMFSRIVLNFLKHWRKHLVSFSVLSFRPLIWLPQTPASLRKCRITPNDSAIVCPRQDSLYQLVYIMYMYFTYQRNFFFFFCKLKKENLRYTC